MYECWRREPHVYLLEISDERWALGRNEKNRNMIILLLGSACGGNLKFLDTVRRQHGLSSSWCFSFDFFVLSKKRNVYFRFEKLDKLVMEECWWLLRLSGTGNYWQKNSLCFHPRLRMHQLFKPYYFNMFTAPNAIFDYTAAETGINQMKRYKISN